MFSLVAKLTFVVQVNPPLLIGVAVIANSYPRLYIEPTLAKIEFPGIPFEGACGTFKIKLLISLL